MNTDTLTFDTMSRRLIGRVLPVVGRVTQPLIVADGMGVDSTALLIELARRYKAGQKEYRPDLILFADPKSEWPETYWYRDNVRQPWLESIGFPKVITVQYTPVRATYDSLVDNCIQNATFPGIVINKKNCSMKYKREPQDRFCRHWELAQACWAVGMPCIKLIGYDAGPKDARRSTILDDPEYKYIYPLREIGWDRDRCIEVIRSKGLPGWTKDRGGEFIKKGGIPVKSACTFCSSMKPPELVVLCKDHPDRGLEIVAMEAAFMPYVDPAKIEGMWRQSTKSRPGSMTQYILANKLLPERDVFEAQERGRSQVKDEVKARRSLFVLPNGESEDEDPCF